MKKVLSDYIKSKEDFERFCNLFLKMEDANGQSLSAGSGFFLERA